MHVRLIVLQRESSCWRRGWGWVRRYEELTRVCPEVEEYKIYYAQSLYKAAAYPEALKVVHSVQGYATRMTKLQAAIAYEQEDTMGEWAHRPAGPLGASRSLGGVGRLT